MASTNSESITPTMVPPTVIVTLRLRLTPNLDTMGYAIRVLEAYILASIMAEYVAYFNISALPVAPDIHVMGSPPAILV